MSKKRLGECCPVMQMVLARDTHGKSKAQGFEIGTTFHLNGKAGSERLIYCFSKAKRTDTSEYGAKSQFANSTFATLKHCPFCGDKIHAT